MYKCRGVLHTQKYIIYINIEVHFIYTNTEVCYIYTNKGVYYIHTNKGEYYIYAPLHIVLALWNAAAIVPFLHKHLEFSWAPRQIRVPRTTAHVCLNNAELDPKTQNYPDPQLCMALSAGANSLSNRWLLQRVRKTCSLWKDGDWELGPVMM